MRPELSKRDDVTTFARMNILASRTMSRQQTTHHNGAGEIVVLCAEEEVRDVIAYWLGCQSAKAVVANDGYHASKMLQNGCRWLVTDRVLPPWPGLDPFLTLRSQHPHLRIAYIENGNIHDGILARVTGANVLLQRPLTRQAVNDALARAEA
jgi:twitching motility two-component system response regulator PilG